VAISRDVAGPLLGRSRELALLVQVRRDARRYGRSCFITGEAGIGKSRLLKQFFHDVPRGRAGVGIGRALEHVSSPFAPWIAAFESVAPAAAAALRPQAHADRAGMYRAVRAALQSSAQRRTTIVAIEDLHWADTASIELLRFLLGELPPLRRLLIVGTLRSAEAPETLQTALALPEALVVELAPLNAHAREDLVRALLPNEPPGSARVARIAALSGGNPLFIEELCKSAGAEEIPTSLQTAIDARVARLSARDIAALESAAVLGERFELALLAEIVRLPSPTVAGRLEAAQLGGIVFEENDGAFRFAHALTRAVLAGRMTAARRIALHQRAARALERRRRFDALGFAQLAYHYAGAHDARRAYAYHMRAGELAYEVYAYADAARFYRDAAAAAERGSLDRARALRRQGDALFRVPALAQAEAAYREAIAIYRAGGEHEEAAALYQSLARSIYNQGRPRDALALIEEAVAALPALAQDALDDLNIEGGFCAADVDPAIGKSWLNRVSEVRVRARERAGAHYLYVRAGIEANLGEADAWQRTVKAFESDAAARHPGAQYIGHFGNLASHALFLGLPAVRLYEQCLTLARTLRMEVYEAAFASHFAFERWLHGDREGFERHLRRAAACEAPIPALRAYLHLGSLLADPAFIPPLDEVYEIVAGGRNEFFGPLAGMTASRLAQRGEMREARRLLDVTAEQLALPYAAWETLLAMAEFGSAAARDRAYALTQPYRDSTAPAFAATAAMIEALRAHHARDAAMRDDAAARARERYAAMSWVHHERRALAFAPAAQRPHLSAREGQIAMLLREGRSNRAMAAELFISEKTVEKHLARLFEKLQVNNRAAAVRALGETFEQR